MGCRVEDCTREATTRGWCTAHYQRWHKTGDVQADVPIGGAPPRPTLCEVDQCDGAHYTAGWCEKHYRRYLRRGETSDREVLEHCTVDGCDEPHDARGYCHGHYQRWQRTGDVQPDIPLDRRRPPLACTVLGCGSAATADGLCPAHYQRRRRRGDVYADTPIGMLASSLNDTRRSQGWLTQGYRYVPVDDHDRHLTHERPYEAEHRLVMARHLGRALLPDESVHHRNGDKLDNRLENLELWSGAQPAGQRVADKVVWALEILERYAPEHLNGA